MVQQERSKPISANANTVYTTAIHNTAQNSSDNPDSYHPNNYHSSYITCYKNSDLNAIQFNSILF